MWNVNQLDSFFNGGGSIFDGRPYVARYRCYPVSFIGKEAMERGNKISMPQSALTELASRNISWPMMFELENEQKARKTHAGVLEFVSEEGMCHIPYWMMQNLLLKEGDYITIRNLRLPKANWVKFRPQTENYWEISNPKAVLEQALRNFATLTIGDRIPIHYLSNVYELDVVDLRPSDACCIIETDMEVEFAEVKKKKKHDMVKPVPGKRLDGKLASMRIAEPPVHNPWENRIEHGVRTKCEEFEKLVRLGKVAGHSAKP